jgi:hypothetical protein
MVSHSNALDYSNTLVMSARLMSNLALKVRPIGIPTLRAMHIVKMRVRQPKAKAS